MTTSEEYLQSEPDEFHLACLLLSPTGAVYLGEALDAIGPEDFYDAHYGLLWDAARKVCSAGQRVTKRTLLAEVNTPAVKARLERVSGEPVFTSKIQASIRTVKELAQTRRLVQALERSKSRAVTAEDYSHALGIAWEELKQLEGSGTPAEVKPFSVLADEFHKRMADGPRVGDIVPTPWPELNELLAGGLHRRRSYVVAARPNEGKSILLANVVAHAAEHGSPSLLVSAEMSDFEVTGRLMAAGGRVEHGEISRYAMSEHTARRVAEYSETHRGMPLWVVDRSDLPIEYIAALSRSMQRSNGLDVVGLDYLQLLGVSDKSAHREQQVSHISKSAKNLAMELHCAVVSAAQLNRQNTRENVRPVLKDLRESGSLEQDADVVILIHHELDSEGRPTGMVTLIVAKNRHGKRGEVEVRFRGHQVRMGD